VPNCKSCGSVSSRHDDYRGIVSVTSTGKTCRRWEDKQEELDLPADAEQGAALLFRWGLEANYCRNMDGLRESSWCFVDDNTTAFEYCLVEECKEASEVNPGNLECGSIRFNQADYRGFSNVTASGRQCQEWSSQVPHAHKYSPEDRPQAGLEGNRCRNPDGSQMAWCFTTDPNQRREYCNVDDCEDLGSFPTNTKCGSMALQQRDYRGETNVTMSGETCMAWDQQEPGSFVHQRIESSGLTLNHCRNPDRSEQAWCYTSNPAIPWEYCSVPKCEEELIMMAAKYGDGD